ncbi:MAG: Gfo/Idh/MocA family oxidoreductase [Sphaerochaeta sp.]|jgi:predicted dehydrogenase|nr:Gfo/Idh/MocA family oxidoreductase [Sphaerochaeta sp.]
MYPIRAALLGAGDRGRFTYAAYAQDHPDELAIVAVAEPDETKRRQIVADHSIEPALAVADWRALFEKPLDVDAIIIAIQDTMHKEAILAAMTGRYHILCEKPVVTTLEETNEIAKQAKHYDKVFAVAHVLRYSRFFNKVRQLVDGGAIGRVIGIELDESVGHIHMSHSFVRGHWSNSNTSAPMILAKSCHDLDILRYLSGSECTSLSSYGDLHHFTREHMPEGATARCTDGCPHIPSCPWAAQKIYLGSNIGWPVSVITTDLSIEGRLKALQEGPWGRCVYQCDNNVVDHQSVQMRFANGIIATFTMSGFTTKTHRTLRLMGTGGELLGDMESGVITYQDFSTREGHTIRLETTREGHSGSDARFVADFVRLVRSGTTEGGTSLLQALQSHYMAFAAETSRLNGGVKIEMSELT